MCKSQVIVAKGLGSCISKHTAQRMLEPYSKYSFNPFITWDVDTIITPIFQMGNPTLVSSIHEVWNRQSDARVYTLKEYVYHTAFNLLDISLHFPLM